MGARRILASLALGCCLIAAGSAFLYFQHTDRLAAEDTADDMSQTAQLLVGEFETFLNDHKKAVALLARLPAVTGFLNNLDDIQAKHQATDMLDTTCSTLGADLCYLLDINGITVASNTNTDTPGLTGKNFAFRGYYQQAKLRGHGLYLALGNTTGELGIYFSNQILDPSGKAIGIAVMKMPPDILARAFAQTASRAALVDPNSIIFASSEPDWVLRSLRSLSDKQKLGLINSRQFGNSPLQSLNFTPMDERFVSTPAGERLMVHQQPLDMLPNWQIMLANQPGPNLLTTALRQSNAPYSFALFLLLTILAVFVLYRMGSADIKRQAAKEAALQHKEGRLRQLLQITNEAIIIHEQGKIIDTNNTAEVLFGHSHEELNNHLLWELFDPQCIAKARNYYQSEDAERTPCEVTAIRSDGHRFPIEISAKTTEIDGRTLGVSCIRDISQYKAQESQIRHQAYYDSLSGLPNRNLMIDRLNQALRKAHRYQHRVAVMFIDLDDFKKVNDMLGHTTGDQLIVAAGERLQAQTREGDTLSRYGGDEFVLILEDLMNLSDVETVAEKSLNALAKEFRVNDQTFYISGSIGIAVYPEDGDNVDDLMQKADTAMYCSKEEGRNSYHFYTPSMNEHVQERIQIERNLRNALTNNELFLHYQPIYCTQSGKLLGAEALLRWQNPELGLVPPDRFIAIAEQTGLIVAIGEWVFQQVCTQTRRWLDMGLENFYVSVNVSPRQFRDPRMIHMLRRTLAATQIPGSTLCIEVTEGLLLKNDQDTAHIISEMKRMGLQLSLDDFGTGYSALSYLKRFPFDNLKIDRSFVDDLAQDASDRQLVQATVAMSTGLGMNVIAEGVELQEQLSFLQQINCYAVQGYLFSPPLDPDTFTRTIVQPTLIEMSVGAHLPGSNLSQ